MHRNDIRFRELLANIYDVQAQVLAVVNLHTECFSRDLLDRSVSHFSFTLRQLHTLLGFLRLRQLRPPDPDTVSVAPGSFGPYCVCLDSFTSAYAVILWNLNFALSGYGGFNLRPALRL